VEDRNKAIEDQNWQNEVTVAAEELGKWTALFTSMFCALLHLPALALESCWPSLLGQIFSFYIAPTVRTTSHWIALIATMICVVGTLGFLFVGAQQRRGLLPLVVGIAGSWLVMLNPIYFLLADYQYLRHTRYATDCIVLLLTIVGVLLLVGASSWNASVDKMILSHFQQHGQKHSNVSAANGGAHILVSGCDSDDLAEEPNDDDHTL